MIPAANPLRSLAADAAERRATQEALVEPSGERPLWKDVAHLILEAAALRATA